MRKSMVLFVLFVLATLCCLVQSFTPPKGPKKALKATPVNFSIPPGWPVPEYNFSANPLTIEGIALGKKLFYDGRLSKDGNFACASCHQQFAAFATLDHAFSHGFNNGQTLRNAPGLFNLAWQKETMWDGSAEHLDAQPLHPLTAPNEMAENIDTVIAKLKKDTVYRRMFAAAFGTPSVTSQRLTRALSQFLLTMVSNRSKYDRVMEGKDSFNLPQQLGYEMFKAKCNTCHRAPLFTDMAYHNVGLPPDAGLKDWGRMLVTKKSVDSLSFKTPSLRNVQLTFPYGHDGRFFSLDQLLSYLPTNISTADTFRHHVPLNAFEMGQIKAFLYTLTDSAFLKDKRFADPAYVYKPELH